MKFLPTRRTTAVRSAMIAFGALLCLDGCLTPPPPSSTGQVTHVVLMWLRHPERARDRAQLIRASHSLRMIPGVLRVETGRTAPRLAPGMRRDFDLAVIVTFRDRVSYERYQVDPRHVAATRRYLRPLVRHYEVYNFINR